MPNLLHMIRLITSAVACVLNTRAKLNSCQLPMNTSGPSGILQIHYLAGFLAQNLLSLTSARLLTELLVKQY